MTIKPMVIDDYFKYILSNVQHLFEKLPEPLPWIEPSINMLYLNAASSLIFGNFYASIICCSTLLEHTLRLAILDPINNGIPRKLSKTQLNKYESISKLLKAPGIENIIPDSKDLDWWNHVAKKLRNKSAHYLIPTLLQLFTGKDYHPENYIYTNDDGTPKHSLLHDWGSFFHKSDYFIATRFLRESTEQLAKIIENTQWKADLSWWESQYNSYEEFFKYNWSTTAMEESLVTLYVDFISGENN